MTRQPNYYKQILGVLDDLQKNHSKYSMGKHFSTALDGYQDIWGVSDKELLLLLQNYRASLEMDVNYDDDDIEDIIKDGMNLGRLFEEEED